MGMSLNHDIKILTQEEFNKLEAEEYYIRGYDLELVDKKEVDKIMKAFFFDIIAEMEKRKINYSIAKKWHEEQDLYKYFKNNAQDIIDELYLEYNINCMLFDSYVSMEDSNFITYKEWLNYEDVEDCDYIVNRSIATKKINDICIYVLVESRY